MLAALLRLARDRAPLAEIGAELVLAACTHPTAAPAALDALAASAALPPLLAATSELVLPLARSSAADATALLHAAGFRFKIAAAALAAATRPASSPSPEALSDGRWGEQSLAPELKNEK